MSAILFNKESNHEIKFPFYSITNKYKNFLSNIVISFTLTEEEQIYYQYKPKLVSIDLYDTPEFWSDILILNNAISVTDFCPKVIKVYDPLRLKSILNEIIILENGIK